MPAVYWSHIELVYSFALENIKSSAITLYINDRVEGIMSGNIAWLVWNLFVHYQYPRDVIIEIEIYMCFFCSKG